MYLHTYTNLIIYICALNASLHENGNNVSLPIRTGDQVYGDVNFETPYQHYYSYYNNINYNPLQQNQNLNVSSITGQPNLHQ